ncbi:nucleotidyltransferase family protein [Methylobacterium sp. JK268]
MGPEPELRARFEAILRADPDLMGLLTAIRPLGLPQWRLVAGCLYQTVWNVLTGRPRGTGIRDYDLVYYDAADLGFAAEDAVIRRIAAAVAGCAGPVETRNQARVHLWFPQRFGAPYPPLASADEGLTRYAAIVHAVGVRLEADGSFDVAAPFGLSDLFAMRVRPNRALANAGTYAEKAARMRAIWPDLAVEPWDAGAAADAAGPRSQPVRREPARAAARGAAPATRSAPGTE